MPRTPRIAPAGHFYHVLNRANSRSRIFAKPADYEAFERVLIETLDRVPMRVLSYCVMPNHWHMVLCPRADGDLTRFMQWLTLTHTQRWHAHHKSAGTGHLYQGRYKSFPIQSGNHLFRVLRYVERNPLRAGLVERAERWRWGSLWRRTRGTPDDRAWLQSWPGGEPAEWLAEVNRRPVSADQKSAERDELRAIRECAQRGAPLGSDAWRIRTAEAMGLESALRPRGRPRKIEVGDEAET